MRTTVTFSVPYLSLTKKPFQQKEKVVKRVVVEVPCVVPNVTDGLP